MSNIYCIIMQIVYLAKEYKESKMNYGMISITPINDLESNMRLTEAFIRQRAKSLSTSLGISESEAENRIYKALPKGFSLTQEDEVIVFEFLELEKQYMRLIKHFHTLSWYESPFLVFRVLKLEKKYEVAQKKFENIACKVLKELVK